MMIIMSLWNKKITKLFHGNIFYNNTMQLNINKVIKLKFIKYILCKKKKEVWSSINFVWIAAFFDLKIISYQPKSKCKYQLIKITKKWFSIKLFYSLLLIIWNHILHK